MGRFSEFLGQVNKYPLAGNTGWITDKGDIIVCSFFEHVRDARKFVQNNPAYTEISCWFEALDNLDQEAEAGYAECDKEGGGWHEYEMEYDSFWYKAVKKLYSDKWVRIYFSKQNSTLTVSGFPHGIQDHYQLTQSLKEALEREFWEDCPNIKVEYEKENEL
ncbi:MAG: hypothetical protein WC119_03230 [Synergistaceae bacterium]